MEILDALEVIFLPVRRFARVPNREAQSSSFIRPVDHGFAWGFVTDVRRWGGCWQDSILEFWAEESFEELHRPRLKHPGGLKTGTLIVDSAAHLS